MGSPDQTGDCLVEPKDPETGTSAHLTRKLRADQVFMGRMELRWLETCLHPPLRMLLLPG
jgi:hypothetical protein